MMDDSVLCTTTGQLLLLACVLVLTVIWWYRRLPQNRPPGPLGLPFLGSLLSFPSDDKLLEYMENLRKTYNSDIVYMNIAGKDNVFVYGLDAIQNVLKTQGDDFDGRPDYGSYNRHVGARGLLSSSGQRWKEQRRFALHILRDFGMGKSALEDRIHEEIEHLIPTLAQNPSEPIKMSDPINVSVANIICQVAFGKRFNYDDKNFLELKDNITELMILLGQGVILDYMPYLQYLPGDFFGFKKLNRKMGKLCDFVVAEVDEHRKNFDEANISDLIDAYLLEQKSRAGDENSTFTDDQLNYVILDLFLAGSETTTTTLRWAILYMILNPEIQEKVQAEIDSVIPRERRPFMSDRAKMVYTQAVICEIQRYADIVPFGISHSNLKPARVLGYDIPAGSAIDASLTSVHTDPKIWKFPNDFNPQNFLCDSGNLINQNLAIPFSIGRRACLGESLARMELFLFFTAMMQEFRFDVDTSRQKPSLEKKLSFVVTPEDYHVRITKRSSE